MIDKQEVVDALKQYFETIYFDSKAQGEYSKALYKKYDMMPGEVSSFIINSEKLETIKDDDLYRLASCAKLKIDIKQNFSPREIKEYSINTKSVSDNIYPIILKDVLLIDNEQYVTTISTKKIYEFYTKQIVSYNPLTQRGPKVSKQTGEVLASPYLNMNSVYSIENLLLNDLFISNDLSFNIRREDERLFEYDSFNKILKINDGGGFDIIDGYHRYQAIIRVMTKNPDYDKNFVLNIMKFKEDKAQRFVTQQNKRNDINPIYARALDTTRLDTLVIRNINQSTDSYFYGRFPTFKRIGGKIKDVNDGYDYVNATNAVKKAFVLKDTKDVDDVAD